MTSGSLNDRFAIDREEIRAGLPNSENKDDCLIALVIADSTVERRCCTNLAAIYYRSLSRNETDSKLIG